MLNVALTGNVASGKSTVAKLFRRWGATIIDADELVREAQRPGSPALAALARRFGPEVLQADGNLDRPAVRALMLSDPAARAALNAIMHPLVQHRRDQLIAEARTRGDRVVVSDIPLLFEAADPAAFDRVVLVDAPAELRLRRLITERGFPEAEAMALMGTQWPAEQKRVWRGPGGRAPIVIDNDGDLATLEQRAHEAWERMME